jgi:hypothetical protein
LFCTYEWYSIGRVWDEQKAIIKTELLAGLTQNTEGIKVDEDKHKTDEDKPQ